MFMLENQIAKKWTEVQEFRCEYETKLTLQPLNFLSGVFKLEFVEEFREKQCKNK